MLSQGIRLIWMTSLMSCLAATSCSQKNSTGSGASILFVGSTPCDSLIRSILQIPPGDICEFIKWELTLPATDTGSFRVMTLYGESQPNTNGFKGGGKAIHLSGQYKFEKNKNGLSNSWLYTLNCDQLREPLLLMAMDENILHFTDRDKRLLVGNGGWGYVLNKINSK